MNLPTTKGGEISRTELWEWVAMIAIIVSWWPRLFMGVSNPIYLGFIYIVDPLVLVVIFVRRLRRVNEGLDYSKNILDAQAKVREEAEKAEREKRRRK